MGNQYTQEYSHDYCINLLKKQLESRCPEWEYVRGYTWSDGKVILRNKNCGHEKEVSCITIRKVGNEDANRIQRKIVCKECLKEEARNRKVQKQKRIEQAKARAEKERQKQLDEEIRKLDENISYYEHGEADDEEEDDM